MALPPQKFREIVFQLLYSHDFSPLEQDDSVPFMMQELKVTKRSMLQAHERVAQVLEKLPLIDVKIEQTSTEYSFDRISRVEKTILRLAVFELLYDPSIPPKVAIAEAIRLCRKFGTPESAHFVNAILDPIFKKDCCEHSNKSVSV
ncbi:MAG: transcription antitermination factor NusB [Verrucomicrobiota bacterium]|nr:transcription antitermination factor NusB [Verrucomicrobiota bacterium]